MKKAIVFILVFFLPVTGIIIFKFFSKSYFDTNVYYQQSVPALNKCKPIQAPYHIPEDLVFYDKDEQMIYPFGSKSIKVFSFLQKGDFMISELNKVSDVFFENDVVNIYMLDSLAGLSKIPFSENIEQISPKDVNLEEFYRCILLFDESRRDNSVLVDGANRIRGYYNLLKREETDSLIIETKIVLRNLELN